MPGAANMTGRLVVIDPGRDKYGWAVFNDGELAAKGVQQAEDAPLHLREITRGVDRVLVGDGTSRESYLKVLAGLEVSVDVVDERGTTQEGLALYFRHEAPNTPVWWLRRFLNLPKRPVDDWAAVAIARRYFSQEAG